MILSFADDETKAVFDDLFCPSFPPSILNTARRKLIQLNASRLLSDLRIPPGNRLEALKGDRKGQHSIRINDRWRICFTWTGTDATGVEITDYH
ncbi:MAG: type II toxin-antitoxin system RelE/ParE family toxin [Undibacterium sp.]|nr:type II toxin-antitoxin system RelE/ParE family toxin [Opitutaceae bacterium]